MKVMQDLDAEKEVAFYKGMTTERLLQEDVHWSDQAPAKAKTDDTPAKELTTDEEKELYV